MSTTVSSKMSTLISEIDNGEKGNRNGKIDSKEEIQMFTYRADNTLSDFDHDLEVLYENQRSYKKKSEEYRAKAGKTGSKLGGLAGAIGVGLKCAGAGSLGVGLVGAILGGAVGLIVGHFAGRGIGALTDSDSSAVDNIKEQIQRLQQQKQEFKNEYETMKNQLNIDG